MDSGWTLDERHTSVLFRVFAITSAPAHMRVYEVYCACHPCQSAVDYTLQSLHPRSVLDPCLWASCHVCTILRLRTLFIPADVVGCASSVVVQFCG